jgi:3-polyprenyl-4-hydroxybenzoate decarboxylase
MSTQSTKKVLPRRLIVGISGASGIIYGASPTSAEQGFQHSQHSSDANDVL